MIRKLISFFGGGGGGVVVAFLLKGIADKEINQLFFVFVFCYMFLANQLLQARTAGNAK